MHTYPKGEGSSYIRDLSGSNTDGNSARRLLSFFNCDWFQLLSIPSIRNVSKLPSSKIRNYLGNVGADTQDS